MQDQTSERHTYSVCLLYPKSIAGWYGETFFQSVDAESPEQAIDAAKYEMAFSNGWIAEANDEEAGQWLYPAEDIAVVLVLAGHHDDITPAARRQV